MKPLITQESPEERLARALTHKEKLATIFASPLTSMAEGRRLKHHLDAAVKAVEEAKAAAPAKS
jgi:hypothetical protein